MTASYAIAFIFTPVLVDSPGWLAVLLHERSLEKTKRCSTGE